MAGALEGDIFIGPKAEVGGMSQIILNSKDEVTQYCIIKLIFG